MAFSRRLKLHLPIFTLCFFLTFLFCSFHLGSPKNLLSEDTTACRIPRSIPTTLPVLSCFSELFSKISLITHLPFLSIPTSPALQPQSLYLRACLCQRMGILILPCWVAIETVSLSLSKESVRASRRMGMRVVTGLETFFPFFLRALIAFTVSTALFRAEQRY